MKCAACNGRRWIIAEVDGFADDLRIERCDACSDGKLTDADVAQLPDAQDALREARQLVCVALAVETSQYLKCGVSLSAFHPDVVCVLPAGHDGGHKRAPRRRQA